MNITVNEKLKAYIDPLTPDEHKALERSILAEGCRDALVLWGDVLVDGHNRYGICQKHGLPFQTVQNTRFQSMEDVHLWMIDQHLGRRSVSDFQRGVLALRKREILEERRLAAAAENASPPADAGAEPNSTEPLKSRSDIAKAARLSSSQVMQIEKIQKQAAPELVAAVKAGTISINAAAAVATLPTEDQKSAVLGGKDELKQAAKRVREIKLKPAKEEAPSDASSTNERLADLQLRLQALTEENHRLRQQVLELQTQLNAVQ
ncbi:plasmid replication/partition related protein [Limnohabitans sp. Jir72]|uniref:plasmid replication/partition related protein n=1 Tax=Limnohabitans sp. Jir72 TaxID=1977909 RepID=UPI000D35B9FD|nr:plasmid replication/partition related protein [Limnohabitans sp. Jir72]PUE36083.1 plasmid replication/partition related protein [Limnohabitans sp. Jir72]